MVKKMILSWLIVMLSGTLSFVAAQGNRLVDPMRPLQRPSEKVGSLKSTAEKPASESLQLLAVLTSADRSVAVINGKLLQKGERIGGYKLIQISSDQVVLQSKSGKRTLHRSGTGLKKRPTKSDVKKGSKL